MLKASALYIVIIIALVIGVLCSSLIVSAYYYKLQYQKKFRYDRLQNNLSSGINILLGTNTSDYKNEKAFTLFSQEDDSVSLKKMPWGVFDIGLCKAFIQSDTLYKAFSIANAVDSSKWCAVYLIDEDRPLSVSGKTMIRGSAFIPKAGVKEAYVDGKSYQGDKRIIIGTRHDSERTLPALQTDRLNLLEQLGTQSLLNDTILPHKDSISISFFAPTKIINFKKKVQTISNIKLTGNLILLSDTAMTIDNTTNLENVLIFAKTVTIKKGFHGTCQIFARDSIGVEPGCTFDYPSCLGIIRTKTSKGSQGRIALGENTNLTGAIFTYEKEKSQLQTIIDVGKHVKIYGQVYVQGLVKFNEGSEIYGSVFTNRFLYQSTYTTYENYLINVKLDVKGLSRYYLTSSLFPVASKKQKTLQWLQSN